MGWLLMNINPGKCFNVNCCKQLCMFIPLISIKGTNVTMNYRWKISVISYKSFQIKNIKKIYSKCIFISHVVRSLITDTNFFLFSMATTLQLKRNGSKGRLIHDFDDIMKLYISNDVKGMEVKKPGKAFRRVLMKSQPAL